VGISYPALRLRLVRGYARDNPTGLKTQLHNKVSLKFQQALKIGGQLFAAMIFNCIFAFFTKTFRYDTQRITASIRLEAQIIQPRKFVHHRRQPC
jgi:hypothetical protein